VFKERLKFLMAERDLKQVDLAKIIGVRQSQVSNWLSGKSLPTLVYFSKICRVFGIDANDMLQEKN